MSDYNAGDLVEAIKGETVIRGRLTASGDEFWVGDSIRLLRHLCAPGWAVTVIERAKPALPTEPWRCYVDKYGAERGYGNIWFTDGAGRMHAWPEGGNPDKYAPFIRLELPAETAKKVLAALGEYLDGQLTGRTKNDIIGYLAAEFGVTGELGE